MKPKPNRRTIFVVALIWVIAQAPFAVAAQAISTSCNYHTASYSVLLPNSFDLDQNAVMKVRYRETGASAWKEGFPPDRVGESFVGSLFQLQPDTEYELEGVLIDSIPSILQIPLPLTSMRTRAEPNIQTTATIKWVSPNGSGNAYTEAAPGDLKTLLASGLVSCGTTVFLKNGIYHTGEMSLSLTSDCSEASPVNLMAAPGATPIIDGGITQALVWTQDATDPALYSATLPTEAAYSTLCLLDSTRLYPYPSVNQIVWGPFSHPYFLKALNLGAEGFVRDASQIWIKTAAGVDPNEHTITLSRYKFGLVVYGNNKQNHLKIKGITFRHFGKATVENGGGTIYHDRTLDLRSINHLTIDSCIFEWNNDPMLVTGASSFFTVQHCRFKDQTGLWSHAQVKKSNDVYFQPLLGWVLPSTFGRSLENAAISMFANECRNYVVRNNYIDGYCNGITANFATNTINDADFYGNTITRSFDGIECDGPWRNLKVWGNDVSQMLAGISMAPPMGGPNYIFRNVFHHIISRWNVADDPYYIGCQPVNSYFSQGLGIKTNSGSTDGGALLYFINNTFHTADTLGFAAFIWDNEWGRMNWINNSFNSESEHLFYLASALNDTDFQLNSSHDHVDCPNGVLLQIKEIHGQFTCHETPLAANMEELTREVTGSERVFFRQTVQGNPKFKNPAVGNFELQPGSPMIDAGLVLPGFYDYSGIAPDIGAKESAAAMSPTATVQLGELPRVFPNPGAGLWYIRSNEPLKSGALFDTFGRLLQVFNFNDEEEVIRTTVPSGVYYLELTSESGRIFWNRLVRK